jgi:hypothetical protein
MAQFSVKIMRLTGSVLSENQQRAYMERQTTEARQQNAERLRIKSRLKSINHHNKRLMEWALNGVGDETEHLAKMKELGQERDKLAEQLERLPHGTNVIVLPTAIQHFADRLRESRAKLHVALSLLDDMGELSSLIREVIDTITLHKDADGVMWIEVQSWLEPFIKDETSPAKASTSTGPIPLVAEEGLEPPTRGL